MKVRGIAAAFPKNAISTQELADWTGHNEQFIREKIGVESRFFCSSEETTVSLSVAACQQLFEEQKELSGDIVDCLVLVTQNPDHKIPHSSALIHSKLGLKKSCVCFDISLACSGWVYALNIVKGLMLVEGYSNALLVTCDPYSKIMGKNNRNTSPIFGDAAAVTWLSDKGAEIGKGIYGTLGNSEILGVKVGGSRYPLASIHDNEIQNHSIDEVRVHMDGRKIFEFMMSEIPQGISECLERNNLSLEGVDLFAIHQGSSYLLNYIRSHLGISEEKLPVVIGATGNTVSSSIPLLLRKYWGSLADGNKTVLVAGFGAGLSWGINIIRF